MGKNKKRIKEVLRYVILIALSIVVIFPILWMCSTAFKTRVDIFAMPPVWLLKPVMSNYYRVFVKDFFLRYYINSLIVSALAVSFALLVGIPCGYGLSRFEFKHKEDLAFWILSTRMAPPVFVIIPFFILWRRLGLTDTYVGLAILYALLNLGLVVWLMRAFFDGIPKELEEVALLDGCSRLQALLKIVLPLCKPGLMAAGLFSFIMCWNEFLFALVLTSGNMRTAPVAVSGYITFRGINWGPMAAAGTLIILPVLIIALLGQKSLVRGFMQGAIR